MRPAQIFHVARAEDWDAARADGAYRWSTAGRTLEEEGFVHCAGADQVDGVLERYYAGATGLVLLTIDVDRLSNEVRVEDLTGAGETFPHVYGPIDLDAVVEVRSLEA